MIPGANVNPKPFNKVVNRLLTNAKSQKPSNPVIQNSFMILQEKGYTCLI